MEKWRNEQNKNANSGSELMMTRLEKELDEEYLKDSYDMITDRIREKLQGSNFILIGHTGTRTTHQDVVDFSKLWAKERGLVNHYTQKGNEDIFNYLQSFLRK